MATPHRPWILGIDLGTNSLGWAALELQDNGSGHPESAKAIGFLSNPHDPKAPPTIGSRIFEAGKEGLGQGKGKESTRNAARRLARQVRRNLMRRERRLRKTFNLLVGAGLLPDAGRHESEPSIHGSSLERDEAIKALDAQIHARYREEVLENSQGNASLRLLESLPYFLRTRALDDALSAQEFGRALYHLAQRRGYKSNRKAANLDEDGEQGDGTQSVDSDKPSKKGKVAQGISDIADSMRANNHRTLGEHLLHEVPFRRRLRARWTARSMYEHEFDTLWAAQVAHGHLNLSEDLRKAIREAIFHQRPLKSQRHLIGFCTLEDGARRVRLPSGNFAKTRRRRRMPQFFTEAQQFRLLQSIHDLRFEGPLPPTILPLSERERELLRQEVIALEQAGKEASTKTVLKSTLRDRIPGKLSTDGKKEIKVISLGDLPNLIWVCESFGEAVSLTPDQKETLFRHMEITAACTWAELKALLGLPKQGKFTAEKGGGRKFLGNLTSAQFYGVFQSRWLAATETERIAIVEECYAIEDDAALKRRIRSGEGPWRAIKAEPSDAEKVLKIATPPDYLAYSRVAVKRLLPLMLAGKDLTTAKAELYPDAEAQEACEFLPPVLNSLGDTRNPVVQRALTEVRRVVNMLIKLYGRPSFIRVEMARDLKASVEERKRRQDQMRSNEKERDVARQAIAPLMPGRDPSATDIEKYRLWQECGGVCPYTGRPINMRSLFGAGTDVDIEHIVPFSISQDNSFLNKTLCDARFNRDRKRNQTPWQTLHGSPEEWNLAVSRMKGNVTRGMHPAKLERFLIDDEGLEEFLGEFTSRQLNDTRYASRLAIRYLAELYGGVLERGVDAGNRTRVQAGTGGVTATLRSVLQMSRALGGELKTRDDHRHHAIDAVAVALAGPRFIQAMARSCGSSYRAAFGKLGPMEPPWASFHQDLAQAVQVTVVSHQNRNPVRGALHKDTNFARRRDPETGRLLIGETPGSTDVPQAVYHQRKPLKSLSLQEVDEIVDPVIRKMVREALNGGAPEKVFADEAKLPRMPSGVIIRRARIRCTDGKRTSFGTGHRRRDCATSENHHAVLWEEVVRGKLRWQCEIISLADAAVRRAKGNPIFQQDLGPDRRFLFHVQKGDVLHYPNYKGQDLLACVKRISMTRANSADIESTPIADARQSGKPVPIGCIRIRCSPTAMCDAGVRKVTIDAIGRVRPAHAQPNH